MTALVRCARADLAHGVHRAGAGATVGPADDAKLAEAHQARVDCDHERAKSLYEEVLRSDPLSHDARWGYGLVLYFLGSFDEALAELGRLCSMDNPEAQWVYDLAMTQMTLGEYDAAKPNFERAVKLDREGEIAEKARKQLSYF